MSDQTRNLKKFYLLSLLLAVIALVFYLNKKDLYIFNQGDDLRQADVEEIIEEKEGSEFWFNTKLDDEEAEDRVDNTKIIRKIIGLL